MAEQAERRLTWTRPRALAAAGAAVLLAAVAVIVVVLRSGADRPAPIEAVGTATTFASGNAATARTALPLGVTGGDLLVSVVSTYGFATVRFPSGWATAYDIASPDGVRMTAAWKVASTGDTAATAAIAPATQVTMATVALRHVAAANPVSRAVGTAGNLPPAVPVAPPGAVALLTHASTAWNAVPVPPDGTSLQATVNNGGNSEVSIALQAAAAVTPSGSGTVSRTPAASVTSPAPEASLSASSSASLSASSSSGAASVSSASAGAGSAGWMETDPAASASGIIVLAPSLPGAAASVPAASSTRGAPASSAGSASATPSAAVTATPSGTLAPVPGAAPAQGTVVCGTPGLTGPASAPAGAVTVQPGQSLRAVVEARGGAATYWLAPGVHSLGDGPYDSVVPHSGDTFIGAPGAVLDGRHRSLYAFTGSASDVTIQNLTIQNFGAAGQNNNEGVVNKDSSAGWRILGSTIQDNAGAGLMLGSGNQLRNSCVRNNGQYAFNAYHPDGVTDVVVDGNELSGNNTDDWEKRQPECGCSGGGKFWATVGAQVTNNYIHDNKSVGLWADSNNSGFLIEGNYISGNSAEGLLYEISYNARIVNNTFERNAFVSGPKNPTFPTGAIYLSESGSDSRAPGPYGDVLRVSGNVFRNNWSGVVAWENADRFAGSPANTSTGMTTLVSPRQATEKACSTASTVAKSPYLDDCRWKTKNVLVDHNTFTFDPAAIPGCSADTGCGFNGLFSNYGSYPDWSPYKGTVVQDHITFSQGNIWRENTYTGPWTFMAHAAGNVVPRAAWQSAPYLQDLGSVFH